MGDRKSLIKKLLIFMGIMGVLSLGLMLISAYKESRSQIYIDVTSMELVQLEKPQDGDPIAVIDTSLGEIRVVLYPEYSPEAVENFTELAESGYYDNTYVFHSEEGVYSAGGAKLKDGSMPEDYEETRELVERELHQNLWPFKGALCSMTTTVDGGIWESIFGGETYYCGSRFALLNTVEFNDEFIAELRETSASEELADAFVEKGGIPNFSQQMTIIGQTYEGIEVVEELASLETEGDENDTYKIPKEDIMILSVEIGEYSSDEEASAEEE